MLIAFGAVLLVFIAVIAGGFYWASTVETVNLTAADLDVGGSYPAEERQALLDACKTSSEAEGAGEAACTCVADNSGTQLSRVERLLLEAGLEESPTKIVAVTKGLIFSGVPQEKLDEMRAYAKRRIRTLLDSCGLERDRAGLRFQKRPGLRRPERAPRQRAILAQANGEGMARRDDD